MAPTPLTLAPQHPPPSPVHTNVSASSFIFSIIDLIEVLGSKGSGDTKSIVSLSITVVVLFIGAYGSYIDKRAYLMTFALILVIALIVGFLSPSAAYGSLGTSIVAIVLAVCQSELIRRGYA